MPSLYRRIFLASGTAALSMAGVAARAAPEEMVSNTCALATSVIMESQMVACDVRHGAFSGWRFSGRTLPNNSILFMSGLDTEHPKVRVRLAVTGWDTDAHDVPRIAHHAMVPGDTIAIVGLPLSADTLVAAATKAADEAQHPLRSHSDR